LNLLPFGPMMDGRQQGRNPQMSTPGLKNALLNDPEHWRQRAEEARAIADGIADPEAKRTMLRIAEGYDHLAERAEDRLLTQLSRGAGLEDSGRTI
jgi:hypothetical protein